MKLTIPTTSLLFTCLFSLSASMARSSNTSPSPPPPPGTTIQLSTENSQVVVGQPASIQIQLMFRGSELHGATKIELSITQGDASIRPSLAITDQSGHASVDATANQAGDITITADFISPGCDDTSTLTLHAVDAS